jgi:salicylate hydroxylase
VQIIIMAADKNFEVAIVGGGIAGLTLAIALHQRKIKVAIYEQAPKFGEIGAGVSFGPNAVEAMKVCDKGIYEAFEKIATHNQWKSKTNIWFDFLNAYDANPNDSSGHQETVFTLSNSLGQNGVHRANFLDEMVRLLPKDIANFGKRLKNISQDYSTDKLTVEFHDGTSAQADAVIGCDGIKSRVRQVMLGDNHPSARPVYTHKYAYRGLIPMEKAVEAIGEERARNACLHVRHPLNSFQTMIRTYCIYRWVPEHMP